MNFGRGVSVPEENDMQIGGGWVPANPNKQFLVRPQAVPVDRNQAGRSNWQALMGLSETRIPGTQNYKEVVQNMNLAELGGTNQALYNWDGNFVGKNGFFNQIAGSYDQTFVDGGTSLYKQAFPNGGTVPYLQAFAKGSQPSANANGASFIHAQALANGATRAYSQALANGGDIYGQAVVSGGEALANGGNTYGKALVKGGGEANGNGGTTGYNQVLTHSAIVNGRAGTYSQPIGNGIAHSCNLGTSNGDRSHGGAILNNYFFPIPVASSSASLDRHMVMKPPASETLGSSTQVTNRHSEPPNKSHLHIPDSLYELESNWGETSSFTMLLMGQNQPSMPTRGDNLLQMSQYGDGFPIPYQPSFNLNSPPHVEAYATSSISNSLPCPPLTPEQPKKLLNFSAVEKSSPHKDQDCIVSTANAAIENHFDQLLHNIVESSAAAPSTSCNANNLIAKEGDEVIDLNKTPQQKQVKKRKHRPKVVIEGKPKRIPKPKAARSSNPKNNPTGKRKYVRKNNPRATGTNLVDATKETTDPSVAGSTEKPCRRVLNFEQEKSEAEGQHKAENHRMVMQQENESTYTSNSSSQAKSCTGINISGTKVTMQNGVVESQKMLADCVSMLKVYTPAAQPATMRNLQEGNLNVILRTAKRGHVDPCQSSKNAHVPVPEQMHANRIDQIVNQPITTQENLNSSRRQMMQSTCPSLTYDFANANQARGLKREYCHTIGQSQAHDIHLIGSSPWKGMFQVDEYNSSNLHHVFSQMQKKRKIENLRHIDVFSMPSRSTVVEDELWQTKAKALNDCEAVHFISQINHQTPNSCFEGKRNPQKLVSGVNNSTSDSSMHPMAARSYMHKQHISNEWPSQQMGNVGNQQANGFTQLHNFTTLTATAKDKRQPPSPKNAQSSHSGYSIESCRAIMVVEKQTEPVLSNLPSSNTAKQFLQEPMAALYDQQQPLVKRRGRPPGKQKYPIQIDGIIERLKNLQLNDASKETPGQEENAIVLYKGDGSIIPYEIKKRKPRPRVDLDSETERVWKLLMGNEGDNEELDENKAKWWEEEREVFRGRADSFIARMHLVQGDRRFSPWKGSVVDSVIGVFLTQNVSDHLSSSAFMSLVARFPLQLDSNKTRYSHEASISIEEPEVSIVNPDATIKWHEKVSHQHVYNQTFITSAESSEHRRDSQNSGTSEMSLTGAPNRRTEEEVMSSQDSFESSIIQTIGLRSCSGSNSETEDPATRHKTSKIQGSTSTNGSLVFDESSTAYRLRNTGLDRVDNLKNSSSFTYPINSSHSHKQVPILPSNHYLLHMTPDSGILEVESTLVLGEESISSLPSNASGITRSKDMKWSSKGPQQMMESVSRTTGQQRGIMNLQETPESIEESSMQSGCRTENNRQSCNTHHLKNAKTFQLESTQSREPTETAGAQDAAQNTTIHPIQNVPRLTEETSNLSERDSAVDKQISLENVVEPLSKEQVHSSSRKESRETTTILKPKNGKIESKRKNAFDWDSLRKQVQASGRKRENKDTMDSLDYEALRSAPVSEISEAIKERGMNNMLAERIKEFLNRLVRDHGSIDLEWLRDAPPDKAKDYLLSIRGLGLKSVECVRLLTLHQLAFPVDTNVGRIAVRLGWVPLQPLPESLQLHLLELYPILESIQKYLWPRLCKLDQRTLYELHYQLITFGKVFCTKSKPNCNACPMRGECRHFASAFASARLALPAPEEKGITCSTVPIVADRNPTALINPMPLPPLERSLLGKEEQENGKCEPIIEVPATPEPECRETLESDIEDAFCEDPEEIPTIKLNFEEFTLNLQNYMQENMELQEGDMSKALVALDPNAASIPTPKLKNVSRLRTEHQVYELPDSHPLLQGRDVREPDDPSPYLLAIWTPGETPNSSQPPERRCESQEGKLCNEKTCFSCNSIREANSQTVRGTLLIPCRTAMRGSFPLNGTYFQVNEVFADHDSSINPIDVPRAWIWNLPRRTVYFGTSVTSIFRGLPTEGIQYCFWRGFVCVRGFDQKSRAPRPLMPRLHLPASRLTKMKNENN